MRPRISKIDRIAIYMSKGMTMEDARRHATADDLEDARQHIANESKISDVDVEHIGEFPEITDVEFEAHEAVHDLCDLTAVVGYHAESAKPMSDSAYRMFSVFIRDFDDNKNKKLLKLEDASEKQMTSRQLTLHLENVAVQTVKDMWNKVKQAFINGFNKIKGWYVKAFSGARKIGEKAKSIRTVADNKQGTITNANFDGSGIATLCIGGKIPDTNAFIAKLKILSNLTQNVLGKTPVMYTNILKSLTDGVDNLSKKAEELEKAEKDNANGNTGGTNTNPGSTTPNIATTQGNFSMSSTDNDFIQKISAQVNELQKSFNGVLNTWSIDEAKQDTRFASMAESGSNTLYKSEVFFGDNMFVVTIPNIAANVDEDGIAAFRNGFGATIEPVKATQNKPDDNGTFKTLAPPQIQQICDTIMDSCKIALDYQMAFKERDACFQNLTKNLDRAANQTGNLSTRASSYIRKNITAATTITGKINNIEGRWYKYSMNVFQKTLGYCQNSLNNIK